jgi:RNA polymerase sigma-70 factor, ECF subfamily
METLDAIPTEVTRSGELVDHLFRTSAGQMVSHLTRLLGSERLDLAEEVVQESLLKALQLWPHSGIPDNPAGWLFRVARNAALDAVRHRALTIEKAPAITAEILRAALPSTTDIGLEEQLRDDELRMVLMCCHPALSPDARVALSLKTVGGFSVREIARAFLAEEATISQRLVRAKRQIREMKISFDLPTNGDLAARLDSLLEVLYLMFNEGYAALSGEELVRQELCGEALRLARLVAASSVSSPTTHALVALMAFQAARLPARVDSNGELVLLEDQDRALWDRRLIALGFHHFSEAAEGDVISPYHLQAAIAAVHAGPQSGEDPDWKTILAHYDQLMELAPSPIVALNRVVAISKVEGAQPALDSLEKLSDDPALRNYYLLPAVKGQLLLDLGQQDAARQCYAQALERPCSAPERRFLQRKEAECET